MEKTYSIKVEALKISNKETAPLCQTLPVTTSILCSDHLLSPNFERTAHLLNIKGQIQEKMAEIRQEEQPDLWKQLTLALSATENALLAQG